jgi:mRNA interferase RelE/StbE
MKVTFERSFSKGIDKLKNQQVKNRIIKLIEKCEEAKVITDIPNVKKMTSFSSFYRFKIGDYRIGVELENDTINFVIVSHRKDIYKVFP